MKSIIIDEIYSIERDTYNWILVSAEKKTVEKDGETKEITSKNESFHASIKQCLVKYLDESLKPCGTIPDLLNKIESIEVKIDLLDLSKCQKPDITEAPKTKKCIGCGAEIPEDYIGSCYGCDS
jgi:hypothetical protein